MKKRFHQIILTCMLASLSLSSFAATSVNDKDINAKVATMTEAQKEARAEEIKTRVEEIKSMDKSTLSKSERKELKAELKSYNKEMRAMKLRGGIYISFAGIIIIILLLILIL
ncbi:MAG TPA: hypothetical protein VHB70_14255 [Parafilimonas sp.]|nr:hypothetical protein [Parafilimonas sp.]